MGFNQNSQIMKILLISSYIFGYMDFAVEEMKKQGHDVDVLYYEDKPLRFEYRNFLHRVESGVYKIFGKNAKHLAREKALKSSLKGKNYDVTLMIHGQYLNHATHRFLKSISKRYIAYFFDSLAKMPKQKKIAHHFDTVFSYEPIDCKTQGYQFITNFILTEKYRSKSFKYTVFNISAHDHRLPVLKKLAHQLSEQKILFKFILYSNKFRQLEHFEITHEKIDFQEIGKILRESKCIVDIQRSEQEGLSFRPFEALGNNKKLITTNQDIIHYDFYNPHNIQVINEKNITLDAEFLNSDYQPISCDIYHKYTLENWVNLILSTNFTE